MGMSAGRIDASPLAVSFNFVAEELGFNSVGSYLDVIPDYQVSVFAVNRGWAERNRRQLLQFKRGMVRREAGRERPHPPEHLLHQGEPALPRRLHAEARLPQRPLVLREPGIGC